MPPWGCSAVTNAGRNESASPAHCSSCSHHQGTQQLLSKNTQRIHLNEKEWEKISCNLNSLQTVPEGNFSAGTGQWITYLIHPKKESKLSLAILINTLPEVQEIGVTELQPLEGGDLLLDPVQQFLSTNCSKQKMPHETAHVQKVLSPIM